MEKTVVRIKECVFGMMAILMLVLVVGCSNNTQEAKTENPSANQMHSITDINGREVSVKSNVEKVVITFNIEEYLVVTGKQGVDKIVGYSHKYWKGRREDAWNTYTKAFPELTKKDDVGYNDDINVEKIISLAPDVVFMSSSVNYEQMEPQLERFKNAGVPVVFFDFHKQTVESHKQSMEIIGQVMGNKQRGSEIGEYYEKQMKIVTDKIATLDPNAQKPKVYMEFSRGVGNYGDTWSEKMWGALIRTCGGENIAAGLTGNSVQIAPEKIIAANPDVIMFTASPQTDIDDNIALGYGADLNKAKTNLEAYKNRGGWNKLSAVTNNNMSAVYHDLSRHIFDFAGTQYLAKKIHPELFKDVDPEANLKEFFDKYMPVELEGAWIVSLTKE